MINIYLIMPHNIKYDPYLAFLDKAADPPKHSKMSKTSPKFQCLVRTSKVAIGKSRSVATSLFV